MVYETGPTLIYEEKINTFTAAVPKFISSGKSKMALAPIALTGTRNFSLSVIQMSS